MFSWVCPRCGHEVPPSKTECPFCFPPESGPPSPETIRTQQNPSLQYPAQQPPAATPPVAAPPHVEPAPTVAPPGPLQSWQPSAPPPPQPQPAAAPQYHPPQPVYHPPQQHYAPPAAPHYHPPAAPHVPAAWQPEEESRRPAWLMAVLAFAGVLALFAAAYFVMGSHTSSSAAKDPLAKQQPTNPLQKYVEVVGVRLISSKGSQNVKFLVVNHAGVELTDLSATVNLYANTQRSEEDTVGTFSFHLSAIGPNDSKELTAPLRSDKSSYDLPEDWRNISADVQVQ